MLEEGRAITTGILSKKNNIDSLSILSSTGEKMTGDLALSLNPSPTGEGLVPPYPVGEGGRGMRGKLQYKFKTDIPTLLCKDESTGIIPNP